MSVGVALVGYGYWGLNLARNVVAARSTELVAVVDADPARQDAARENHPGITTYADLGPALDNPAVEAVIIATPAAMHAAAAIKVLDAGRDVMVEKPLALTVEDADAVVANANASGRIAMVGHTFLYSPPVHRLREYVASGELGSIQYLYSQRLSLGRIRRDCNALWNFAPHDVSIMMFILGERPIEVSSRGFSFIEKGIDDVSFSTLTFPSGIGANIHVSWIDPRKVRLMTVVGDRKMAVYDDVSPDQKIWLHDAGVAVSDDPSLGTYASFGEFQWKTRAGDILIPKVEMTEPLLCEMEAFGHACRTREPPVSDARHGADVVRILVALDESAQKGGSPVAFAW